MVWLFFGCLWCGCLCVYLWLFCSCVYSWWFCLCGYGVCGGVVIVVFVVLFEVVLFVEAEHMVVGGSFCG